MLWLSAGLQTFLKYFWTSINSLEKLNIKNRPRKKILKKLIFGRKLSMVVLMNVLKVTTPTTFANFFRRAQHHPPPCKKFVYFKNLKPMKNAKKYSNKIFVLHGIYHNNGHLYFFRIYLRKTLNEVQNNPLSSSVLHRSQRKAVRSLRSFPHCIRFSDVNWCKF